jgi:glycolate oxidase iron-sulfur subunit
LRRHSPVCSNVLLLKDGVDIGKDGFRMINDHSDNPNQSGDQGTAMESMKELVLGLKELEKDLGACARCGMCQSVCPLYRETRHEGDVARGKLALLDGLLENLFSSAKGVSKRLNRCLLCGSCAANCPNGVNVVEIFLKARTLLSSVRGLSPFRKRFLTRILAEPGTFDRFASFCEKAQKWAFTPENPVIGTSTVRLSSPLLTKNRHVVPLATVPFHRMEPQRGSFPPGVKVLFFVGCLIDKVFPRIAEAVIKVSRHHDIDLLIPPGQGCCGIPALSSGDADAMIRLIRFHLNLFKDLEFDFLVTACATCTYTIRKVWPMMLKSLDQDAAAAVMNISEKTRDICQFIVSDPGINFPSPPGAATGDRHRITYHDPCHLKKSLGVSSEPRALIVANPRYQLVEMEKADQCCGMGGGFNLEHYDLSTLIGNRKLDYIRQTRCQTIAAGCPACMIQFSDVLSRAGEKIRVRHPIEIYAEKLE